VRYLLPLLLLVAIAAAALPFDERRSAPAETPRRAPTATPAATPEPQPRADVPPARCGGDVPGCAAIRGRVVFVERVDPDGDGDLHVVVADGSVTAPGLSAVDVRPDLRPQRDPQIGDRVSAAGPVQTGSYGQSQIHALEFHARRG
jgi:hypothetical protein